MILLSHYIVIPNYNYDIVIPDYNYDIVIPDYDYDIVIPATHYYSLLGFSSYDTKQMVLSQHTNNLPPCYLHRLSRIEPPYFKEQ